MSWPPACNAYREWLDRPEAHDEGVRPAFAEEHPRHCDECRGLTEAYQAQLTHLKRNTLDNPEHAEVTRFVERMHHETRRPLSPLAINPWPRRLAFGGGATLAAAAMAAIVFWAAGDWIDRLVAPAEPVEFLATDSASTASAVAGSNTARAEAGSLLVREGRGRQSTRTLVGPDDAVGPGSEVVAPATLRTGSTERLELADRDRASLSVGPNSRLRVTTWTPRDAVVDLAEGTVRCAVQHRDTNALFEVRTPVAIARVIGTQFTVSHAPGQGTTIEGHQGVVAVIDLEGRKLGEVRAGEQFRVDAPGLTAEAPGRADEVAMPTPMAPDAATSTATPRATRTSPEAVAVVPAIVVPEPTPASPGLAASAASVRDPKKARPRPLTRPKRARVAREPVKSPSLTGAAADATPERKPSEAAAAETPAVAATGVEPRKAAATAAGDGSDDAPTSPTARVEPATKGEFDATLSSARAALAAGDDNRALSLLRPLKPASSSQRSRLQALRGDVWRLKGNLASAVAHYEVASSGSSAAAGAALADLARLYTAEMGDQNKADRAWKRYLSAFPRGSAAAEAHWKLAAASSTSSADRREEHLAAILEQHRSSGYASKALAQLGRRYIASGRWSQASALFGDYLDAKNRSMRETALVGMIRTRAGQKRTSQVEALLERYDREFPRGKRRDELRAIRDALVAVAPS